jgi:Rhs element Vgr protein
MPEERVIPAIESFAEFIIKVNGSEIPRTVSKISVNVMKAVNKISSAILVFSDGDPSSGEFELADGNLFVPGNSITISAGEVNDPVDIFNGIIIKQSIKIRDRRSPQLIVECRHRSVKTTIGRKNACFHESTDSDVFEKILQGYEFNELDIESSTLTHEELVQYNCTDWDFILNRAEMIGKIVLTNDEKIVIKTPTVTGDSALSLLLGATIIELDAEMDSRNQYATVKAKSWDMANQAIAESDASEPSQIEEQGDFTTSELADVAGLNEYTLNHSGVLSNTERKLWADAQMLKSRLSKIRGRAKFNGIATLNPGEVLELNGLGKRFNGKAFVSGVRHDYDLINGWKTQAQFGHSPEWFTDEHEVSVKKSGGLLPGVTGLHTGIVTDNEDPEGEMRVRVKFPYINANDEGVWARISLADAGNERGLFFRPEIGDEVIVGFLYDDPRQPVILGMLHSSALPSPLQPSNDNNQKGYTSRQKMILQFDDDKLEVKIETPAGNKLVISEDQKSITIQDQNNNKILLNQDGIIINDENEGEIITLAKNQGQLKIKANAKVIIEAPQIELVENAAHPLVFGDSLLTYLNQVVQIFNTHMHAGELALGTLPVTPAPPASPIPPPTPSLLSVKVKTG